jgi:hypothetical protein
MTDITPAKASAYLYYVAENPVPEEFTNENFILALAIAYRDGFITGFDWNSDIGKKIREYVSRIWTDFEEWLNEFEPGAVSEIALAEEVQLP